MSEFAITDPRHPLVMAQSAAEMAEKKWRRIADSASREHVMQWAQRKAAFYTNRIAELKAHIATLKGGAS